MPPNAVGIDVGCGSGRWAQLVAPRVGHLHVLDASAAALEVARENLQGLANISFHHATIDAIPLPDRSLDFAYSLGVLHHIPDTARGIGDIGRKLKPGAPFLVYLYYAFENRPAWFRAIWRASDGMRRIVSRLPHACAWRHPGDRRIRLFAAGPGAPARTGRPAAARLAAFVLSPPLVTSCAPTPMIDLHAARAAIYATDEMLRPPASRFRSSPPSRAGAPSSSRTELYRQLARCWNRSHGSAHRQVWSRKFTPQSGKWSRVHNARPAIRTRLIIHRP